MSLEALLAFFTSSLSGLPWEVLKSVEPFDMDLLQSELVGSVLVMYFFSLLENAVPLACQEKCISFDIDVSGSWVRGNRQLLVGRQ